jgi:hypothetical protein
MSDVNENLSVNRAAAGKVVVTASRWGGGLAAKWSVGTFASKIPEGIVEARDGLDKAWKTMKEWSEL